MDHVPDHPERKLIAINTYLSARQLENQGADLSTLRKFNRRLILNHLREQGSTSRVALSNNLGLSRATVGSIVDDLKKDGIVQEGGKLVTGGKTGRRATRLHFNANAGFAIGVDIGRSHLNIRFTDLGVETIIGYSESFDAKCGGKEGLEFVAEKLHEIVEQTGKTWDQVRGIGLSIPGSPDPTYRMMISPPLLSNWQNIDIPAYLRRKLNLKKHIPIYLDNDANMGALGESRCGEGQNIADLIYVKVGTGIGAGLILGGRLYRGSRGVAGEFGHTFINEKTPLCHSCGKPGCLEALAGVEAILKDAREGISLARLRSRDEPEISTVSIAPTLAQSTHEIDIADVLRAADEGDAASRAALEAAGRYTGMAIGRNLMNMYNPSVILLDGGVVRVKEGSGFRMNELFFAALRQSAEDSALPEAWIGTEISTSRLGDSAVALGAAATVIDRDEDFGTLDP